MFEGKKKGCGAKTNIGLGQTVMSEEAFPTEMMKI